MKKYLMKLLSLEYKNLHQDSSKDLSPTLLVGLILLLAQKYQNERDEINNQLEEITEYVFEILQNSNFAQEVHESFMDLAVGTGILHVSEGDAINPIIFFCYSITSCSS